MPFIETKTSKQISLEAEAEIRKKLGCAIEIFSGKSEQWLMLDFQGGARISFRGETEPESAIISVHLLGKAKNEEYGKFTSAVTQIVGEALGIPGERIYVKYTEYAHWGYNGQNF